MLRVLMLGLLVLFFLLLVLFSVCIHLFFFFFILNETRFGWHAAWSLRPEVLFLTVIT